MLIFFFSKSLCVGWGDGVRFVAGGGGLERERGLAVWTSASTILLPSCSGEGSLQGKWRQGREERGLVRPPLPRKACALQKAVNTTARLSKHSASSVHFGQGNH